MKLQNRRTVVLMQFNLTLNPFLLHSEIKTLQADFLYKMLQIVVVSLCAINRMSEHVFDKN